MARCRITEENNHRKVKDAGILFTQDGENSGIIMALVGFGAQLVA